MIDVITYYTDVESAGSIVAEFSVREPNEGGGCCKGRAIRRVFLLDKIHTPRSTMGSTLWDFTRHFRKILKQMSNDMNSSISWIEQAPEVALTLPSRYFYDAEIFEREKKNIFLNGWQLVGHKNELSQFGQYVVTELFNQSVITTRTKNGAVNSFHNVCQHRGNRLVNERRGRNKGLFVCGYHRWCYEANGKLRGAPRSERMVKFNPSEIRCPAVRTEEYFGFYFINLDNNTPTMAELYPGADESIMNTYPDLEHLKLISEQDVVVPANWKVIMDNSIEGYHFSLSGHCHVELGRLIDFSGYRLEAQDKWWTYIAPSDLSVRDPYGVMLNQAPDPDDKFFNIGLWPNNTFYHFPFSQFFATFVMIPTGPEQSLLRFGYYSAHDPLPEVTEASMRWMNDSLGPEDIELNTTVQKGLRSMGYDQGRYMIDADRSNESEHLVHHFHKLVYQSLHDYRTDKA